MKKEFELSVILPLKSSVVKDFEEFFKKSIESITLQDILPSELIIVHSDEESLINYLNNFDFGNLKVNKIKFEGEPNFCEQVNTGIKNSKTEWNTILEFDDEFSKIWFKNVKKYSEIYNDIDVFMPIVVDVDNKSVFAGFTNEATFAANFSQEMGTLTNETLLSYQNFQTSGMVFKKQIIEDFGGFKPGFKLTFVYEFLLRMTYNSVKFMTIPRIGYKHMNLREGSIFWDYKNGDDVLTENEVKFWVNSAKKEYFFSQDRNIKYTPENV
jgi:hypothetical protein